MKDLDYMSIAEDAICRIKKGAFLTVKAADAKNTMTIGWAACGFVWLKPVIMVAVRRTRYTFSLMEKAADFTVTIPSGDMGRTIAFCGAKSGRNMDKFKMADLETSDSRYVASPIIKVPGIHYECKIVYKSEMNPAHLNQEYDKALYPQKDYHTLYFGEILACYATEV